MSTKMLYEQLFINNRYKAKYLLNDVFFLIYSFTHSSVPSYTFILLKRFGVHCPSLINIYYSFILLTTYIFFLALPVIKYKTRDERQYRQEVLKVRSQVLDNFWQLKAL